MGATEEQMAVLANAHVTHVSYILILFSLAFLLFLFVLMLIHLYSAYATPDKGKNTVKPDDRARQNIPNGHARGHSAAERQARDVQEFELEALMSEDEDDSDRPHSGRSNERP